MTKPNLDSINQRINDFRGYVQKVLPAVYDDTLSYYELLSKIIDKLNENGKLTNRMIELWNEVNEWIMNEGLTDAVNDKLDKYVADGTMATIINENIFNELNTKITGHIDDVPFQTEKYVGYRHKINVEDLLKLAPVNGLQGVFNSIPSNTELHFSKVYEVNTELVLNKNMIRLVSDVPSGIFSGGGIKNTGVGNALRIKGSKIELDGLYIGGNGDPENYGEGSTTQHGVILDNSTYIRFSKCHITGHGGNGVHGNGGVWVVTFRENVITGNVGDGINLRSGGTGNSSQTGNNTVIRDNAITHNGGNGVNWLSAALTVEGNDIEQNKASGILIDMSNVSFTPHGVSITGGNYLEQNRGGQIKVISTSSNGVKSMIVEGNYFNVSYSGEGETALIVFEGEQNSNNYVEIGNNAYSIIGSYVTHYLDAGLTFNENCIIKQIAQIEYYQNIGLAQLHKFSRKTKMVSGLTNQKSVPWTSPLKSENIVSTGCDTYFSLPIVDGEFLDVIRMVIESDSQEALTYQFTVYEKLLTTGEMKVVATTSGSQVPGQISWSVSSNAFVRAIRHGGYYLRVIVGKPSTNANATTLFLNDVQLELI